MKVAVIDHIGNFGGGSRVIRALLPAIKAMRPETEMTYFGNPASIERECILEEFSRIGISVHPLDSVRLSSKGLLNIGITAKAIKYLQQCYPHSLQGLPYVFSGEVHKELEKRVRGYDLALFTWPFFIAVPDLECPLVGIFHDFNFKYYFSGPCTFSPQQQARLNREVPQWLARATPIVSTHFIARELEKFYPMHAHKTRVVHLAPMSEVNPIEEDEARKVVRSLGLVSPYILYPTNLSAHKNLGPLLASLPLLRKLGHDVKLALTGPRTEQIRGHACDIGVELGQERPDVVGMGYVSNLQMDSLIQCAAVVVSSSLYEAGNGPGVDAWQRGVPVAMSNIPAFLEHLEVQGVRAEVFDPRSPADIALKIGAILSNPAKARLDAHHSREALQRHTWEQTASRYLSIFDDLVRK